MHLKQSVVSLDPDSNSKLMKEACETLVLGLVISLSKKIQW